MEKTNDNTRTAVLDEDFQHVAKGIAPIYYDKAKEFKWLKQPLAKY